MTSIQHSCLYVWVKGLYQGPYFQSHFGIVAYKQVPFTKELLDVIQCFNKTNLRLICTFASDQKYSLKDVGEGKGGGGWRVGERWQKGGRKEGKGQAFYCLPGGYSKPTELGENKLDLQWAPFTIHCPKKKYESSHWNLVGHGWSRCHGIRLLVAYSTVFCMSLASASDPTVPGLMFIIYAELQIIFRTVYLF